MNKLMALAVFFSVLLVGCGGSGGSTAPVQSSVAATTVPKVVPTQGDYYTFSFTHTPTGGSPSTYLFTRAYYPIVNLDGSLVRVDTFSNGSATDTLNLDAAFGTTSHSYVSGGLTTTCTNSPSNIIVPVPATTSTNWNYNFAQTCTGGFPSTSMFNQTGSLTAFESVSTTAGTFYAGKYVFTQTEVRTGLYTQVISFTCWVDTVLGRTVKCQDTYIYTPVVGVASSGSELLTLSGYSATGLSSAPTVARFAGNWSGSYAGSSPGTCSSLVVSSLGAINGSCVSASVGAFTVTGTVTVAGTVNMTASTGPTFSGSLSSTTGGSGTWIGVPSGGGTWTAAHQ